jgi:hypothetical protein
MYGRLYYTLTFTITFEYDNDTVFFANCHPYTYTDLVEDLDKLTVGYRGEFVSRNTLCRTLAGNKCDYVTITARDNPEKR